MLKWRKRKLSDLASGSRFEKYTLGKRLGRGGMGEVFLARHNVLDTLFAIKILFPEMAEQKKLLVDRFIREAKLACKVRHPNLITVHDAGQCQENGMYYIVMDYVPGGNLRERLKIVKRLSPGAALQIVIQIASALEAAHNSSMVHRDIKPDNIMFGDDGSAKLADLGIAKSTDEQDTLLTMQSAVFGTPAYMSPEQAMDSGKVDGRADIYSLGVVFYEMLSGSLPFSGKSSIEILSQVVSEEEIPNIRQVCPQVSEELAEVVSGMIKKKREERIESASKLLEKLKAISSADAPFITENVNSGEISTQISADVQSKVSAPEPVPEEVAPAAKNSDIKNKILIFSVVAVLLMIAATAAAWLLGQSKNGVTVNSNSGAVEVVSDERKEEQTPEQTEPATSVENKSQEKTISAAENPNGARIILFSPANDFSEQLKREFSGLGCRPEVMEPEGFSGLKRQFAEVCSGKPDAVILNINAFFAADGISLAGFENLIRYCYETARQNTVRLVFILAAAGDKDAQVFNRAVIELGNLKSIPYIYETAPVKDTAKRLVPMR